MDVSWAIKLYACGWSPINMLNSLRIFACSLLSLVRVKCVHEMRRKKLLDDVKKKRENFLKGSNRKNFKFMCAFFQFEILFLPGVDLRVMVENCWEIPLHFSNVETFPSNSSLLKCFLHLLVNVLITIFVYLWKFQHHQQQTRR